MDYGHGHYTLSIKIIVGHSKAINPYSTVLCAVIDAIGVVLTLGALGSRATHILTWLLEAQLQRLY